MTLRIDSLCAGERETLGAIVTGLGDSNRAKMEAQGLDLAQLQRHEMRLVARDGEALPGGLLGYVKYTWLHVDTLWVAPEQQGGGIGAALLGEAERQAMALGAKRSWLVSLTWRRRTTICGMAIGSSASCRTIRPATP